MNPFELRIGEKFVLPSKTLGGERSYWIHLPASYNDKSSVGQCYPVLFLLEAESALHATAVGSVPLMSNGHKIPELIIVAIADTSLRDMTPTHSRIGADGREKASLADSGGSDLFLRFLRDELLPAIASSYCTLPYRIVFGQSIAGLNSTSHTIRSLPAHTPVWPWPTRSKRTGPRPSNTTNKRSHWTRRMKTRNSG